MKTSHTPAPFTIGEKLADGSLPILDNCNGAECIVALVPPNFTDGEKAHQAANAKLFAGAPGMLKALSKAEAWLNGVLDNEPEDYDNKALKRDLKQIRKAIKDATL